MGKPNALLVFEYQRRGYWTVTAMADVLTRPTSTLYSWIRRGSLKQVLRIAGTVFVRYQEAYKLAGGAR